MRLRTLPFQLSLCSLLSLAIACSGRVATQPAEPDAGDLEDAGVDAGELDAGTDAGTDAGVDAGPVLPQLRAGAAAVELIPAKGSPLAGYGAVPRRIISALSIPEQLAAADGHCIDPDPTTVATYFTPNEGTLDPLYVRAVVVDDGHTRMAILKVDAVGFSRQIRDDLVPLAQSLGIPPELLVGVATHTHSGPGAVSKFVMWELIAADCYNQVAYDVMLHTFREALLQAVANLKPARLGIGSTQEPNASQNRRDRPGIRDPEMGILKFVDATTNAPIAEVFNFAIHGTVHDQDNLKFSADVMGVAEHEIERQLGGMAMFINGAEGDVSPANGLQSGIQMANTLAAAWPQIPTEPGVALAGVFEDLTMPQLQYNVGCFPIPGSTQTICDLDPGISIQVPLNSNWGPTKGPFQAIRLSNAQGNTVLAMAPGEPETELGWEIKAFGANEGFTHTFVVSLANDHLSYFTTPAEYTRGLYEGTSTMYGPKTGVLVVQEAEKLVHALKP
ncbi:MAG: neutral/alkaline non-lysosomal ceramidase N-terminal domain-containing protein [Deltaproteobacteria bacterium]|nr:neutral/alkaline non-lysosomal ceramidase N-terminal domain-containing protein [Deltaproteobacteria bacterium]